MAESFRIKNVGKLESKVSNSCEQLQSAVRYANIMQVMTLYHTSGSLYFLSNSNLADGTHTHLYIEVIQRSLQCRTVLGRCIAEILQKVLKY